jgi:hypothetical protein
MEIELNSVAAQEIEASQDEELFMSRSALFFRWMIAVLLGYDYDCDT